MIEGNHYASHEIEVCIETSTHTGKPSVRSELMINNYVDITKRCRCAIMVANKAYGCQSSYPKRHRHIATVYLKGIGVAMLLVLT